MKQKINKILKNSLSIKEIQDSLINSYPEINGIKKATEKIMKHINRYPPKFDYMLLTDKERKAYNKKAEELYGKTYTFSETGEPLYFSEDGTMCDFSKVILEKM